MRPSMIAAAAFVFLAAAVGAHAAPEHMVIPPYPGPTPWKVITNKANSAEWMHEQIPVNQTVAGFTDILTDQGFRKLANRDPGEFLQVVFGGMGKACDGLKLNGPTLRQENGVVVAYAQVYCGQQRGTDFGVHIFYKVISGTAALYTVSREFHVPAQPDGGPLAFPRGQAGRAVALVNAEAAANDYLAQRVYLCGGRSTDPRCER